MFEHSVFFNGKKKGTVKQSAGVWSVCGEVWIYRHNFVKGYTPNHPVLTSKPLARFTKQ